MSFKYSETYIADIEKVCNDILRVANTIKESKEKRKPMLSKDCKPEKMIIGNSEYDISCKEALEFLDSSIYIDERTFSLLILNLHAIEEKRRIESVPTIELYPMGHIDPKRCGAIKYGD